MTHPIVLSTFRSLTLFGALAATGAGCASPREIAAPRAVASTPPTPPTPAPPPPPVHATVSVSEEIAATCKLAFGDAGRAPKFDFDQSLLGLADHDILSQVAKCMTSGPLAGRSVDLIGRADPRGADDYNLALGARRAGSVGDYLTSLGVDEARLARSSRGSADATGTEENGWQKDRRVDLRLGR